MSMTLGFVSAFLGSLLTSSVMTYLRSRGMSNMRSFLWVFLPNLALCALLVVLFLTVGQQ